MADVVPHPTLVEWLRSPELKRLLPDLLAHAGWLLARAGLLRGSAATQAQDVEDVVHTTVELALRGGRSCPVDMDLRTYLRSIAWSWVDFLRRRRKLRLPTTIDEFEDRPAPPSRRDEVIDAREFVAELREEIAGDEELTALFALLADSEAELTREEQRLALGWESLGRVRAAHARLRRRRDAVLLRRTGRADENPEGDRPAGDPAAAYPRARRSGGTR